VISTRTSLRKRNQAMFATLFVAIAAAQEAVGCAMASDERVSVAV